MKYSSPISSRFLCGLFDLIDNSTELLDAFLFSAGSAKQLARNMHLKNRQFSSTFRGLEKRGYIKKINEDQFLITPKSLVRIRISKIHDSDWTEKNWDGRWKLIVFDIPETKRRERNILRSLIKRKGFIGIQESVFISPFADFIELAKLRKDLKIEKYVSFFSAKSVETDDDQNLRKRFNIM